MYKIGNAYSSTPNAPHNLNRNIFLHITLLVSNPYRNIFQKLHFDSKHLNLKTSPYTQQGKLLERLYVVKWHGKARRVSESQQWEDTLRHSESRHTDSHMMQRRLGNSALRCYNLWEGVGFLDLTSGPESLLGDAPCLAMRRPSASFYAYHAWKSIYRSSLWK